MGQGQQGVSRKDMRVQEQIKKSNKGNDGEKHQAKKDMGLGIENKGEDRKTITKQEHNTYKGNQTREKGTGHSIKEKRKTGGREFSKKRKKREISVGKNGKDRK